MAHVTFYRKYRSQTFDEIVGQDHIVQTLKNAIDYDRLSHAYIFSGPRGTGKTSSARILAKALNCRQGPSHTPCLTCDLCERVSKGNSVDVVEIDAASNTGVDNIRTLNEQVNFAPVECLYKLYIIDEAHMLSTGAFNALLKTLEEPPAKTIFILATTEPHKIPVTIHSRCQHLHFRSMSTPELLAQLRKISNGESLEISDDSLLTVSRNAGGSMRDAISLLDQIYAFKGKTIQLEDVLMILGATNFDGLCDLLKSVLASDAKATISTLKSLTDTGVNMTQLNSDLTELMTQLLFIKMQVTDDLDLDESRLTALKSITDLASLSTLNLLLESLAKIEMDLRWFPNPNLLMQVRLMTFIHDQSQGQSHPQPVAPAQPQAVTRQAAPVAAAPPRSVPTPPSVQTQSRAPQPVATRVAAPVASIPGSPSSPNPNPVPPKEPPPPVPPSAVGPDFDAKWQQILATLREAQHGVFSILKDASILQFENEEILIKLKQDFKFFREKLAEDKNNELIMQTIQSVFSASATFRLDGDPVPARSIKAPPMPATVDPLQSVSVQSATQPGNAVAVNESPGVAQASGWQGLDGKENQKINQIVAMFDGAVVNT